jgi:hypothetical protein
MSKINNMNVWKAYGETANHKVTGLYHESPHLVAGIKRRLVLPEWMKQEWLRRFFEVSQKVEKKSECLD